MKKTILFALILVSNLAYAEGVVIERGPSECPPNLRCESTEGTPMKGYNLPEPKDFKKNSKVAPGRVQTQAL